MTGQPEEHALAFARRLADAGAPLFIARPVLGPDGVWDPESGAGGYKLPSRWQDTVADPSVVDKWKPGYALCMVTGVLFDVIDVDPRNGGDVRALGDMVPRVYAQASTPSDGTHLLVKTLGVRKCVVKPGIDLQAGDAAGRGRGFIFLAPTVKLSQTTGSIDTYRWDSDFDFLEGYREDESGAALALLALEKTDKHERAIADYDGPTYADLDVARQAWADRYVSGVVGRWGARLAEAAGWAEGLRDDKGRGWEGLARDFAWTLARLAVCPWTGLDVDTAADLYDLVLPGALAENEKCAGKWDSSLVSRAAERAADLPPWDGLGDVVVGSDGRDLPTLPAHWEDGRVAPWMAYRGLGGMWCWASGLRWMRWDGRRWVQRTEESVREAVRQVVVRGLAVALQEDNKKAADGMRSLMNVGRINAVVSLMRGVVEVEAGSFDSHPDLLNCGNGVVDLRTGDLLPHDPALLMTRMTETAYIPGAKSREWDICLDALEPEVTDWMQVRWGQAATGWPTSDDVLPVMHGSGSNGKTTQFVAFQKALGEHMVQVPAKLIMANPSDHPTELMTLRGARVAYIDETPEAGQLNVARLKAVLGQEMITARAIRQDNVTWRATHSLFLSTNYYPNIAETDHGTWRRLALVKYEKEYPQDDSFRARVSRGAGGIAEAVLNWVVEGSLAWYDADMVIPPMAEKVRLDTFAWRCDVDFVLAYISDRLVFEDGVGVATTDLAEDFNDWLRERKQRPWSERTMVSRFESHREITSNRVSRSRVQSDDAKALIRRPESAMEALPSRPYVWWGMRIEG